MQPESDVQVMYWSPDDDLPLKNGRLHVHQQPFSSCWQIPSWTASVGLYIRASKWLSWFNPDCCWLAVACLLLACCLLLPGDCVTVCSLEYSCFTRWLLCLCCIFTAAASGADAVCLLCCFFDLLLRSCFETAGLVLVFRKSYVLLFASEWRWRHNATSLAMAQSYVLTFFLLFTSIQFVLLTEDSN